MFELADFSQKMLELKTIAESKLKEADIPFEQSDYALDESEPIKLVFAGQYSSGKSSIIRMLTCRDDISVGAGIETQKAHAYEWNGLTVIDTPGVHTRLRPDHDEISYKAISEADMLVFVTTNELFDDHIAQHFRHLAIDRDKAGEMILVVNKMGRAAEGNTAEQQAIIRDDLKKVLAPYTPESFNVCFLDVEDYNRSLLYEKENPALAERLLYRSGYPDFISTLNNFVSSKSITGRLTTTLYKLEETLMVAVKALSPESEIDNIDALEESFMQQRHVITDARFRIQHEVCDIFTRAASDIRQIGLDSANLISENCDADSVEAELTKAIKDADGLVESSKRAAEEAVKAHLEEIEQEFNRIENSDFTRALKAQLINNSSSLPPQVKNIINELGGKMQKAGGSITNKAYNITGNKNGGLQLANFSGSNVHDTVLKVGKAFGHKFKPWEAVKITKGIAVAGQVLSVLGVAFSIGMQIKSDIDEDKQRQAMRTNRQNIRSQFNQVADELEDYGKSIAKAYIEQSLDQPLNDIDSKISMLRETRTNRSDLCISLEKILSDCRKLIREIHRHQ